MSTADTMTRFRAAVAKSDASGQSRRGRGKTTTYGQKGGDGPTAGRKAETISMTIGEQTFTKRVYKGQRWLAVARQRPYKDIVTAWPTKAKAEAHAAVCRKDGWFCVTGKAEVVK